jgi:hypothetical protein
MCLIPKINSVLTECIMLDFSSGENGKGKVVEAIKKPPMVQQSIEFFARIALYKRLDCVG